jgi:hypothetical protein
LRYDAEELVYRAAALLETDEERKIFMREIASRLAGSVPTGKEIRQAVSFILQKHGIAIGRALLG